jgi:hypothetical protein
MMHFTSAPIRTLIGQSKICESLPSKFLIRKERCAARAVVILTDFLYYES